MAMTAWAAKFVTSAICLSVKDRTSWRKMLIAPINAPSLNIGTTTIVRAPPSLAIGSSGYSARISIRWMTCLTFAKRLRAGDAASGRNRVLR